jgi:hypothetical protein
MNIKNIQKKGSHFWILSPAECSWHLEGSSPNRANWMLATTSCPVGSWLVVVSDQTKNHILVRSAASLLYRFSNPVLILARSGNLNSEATSRWWLCDWRREMGGLFATIAISPPSLSGWERYINLPIRPMHRSSLTFVDEMLDVPTRRFRVDLLAV